jgi:predicted transcriptional regulator
MDEFLTVAEVAEVLKLNQQTVALARHYRDAEGLSIAKIAERLGRAPATIKSYFCATSRPSPSSASTSTSDSVTATTATKVRGRLHNPCSTG